MKRDEEEKKTGIAIRSIELGGKKLQKGRSRFWGRKKEGGKKRIAWLILAVVPTRRRRRRRRKNAHTFILHSRKNKRLFINIGRKRKARLSALRSNRAFISAETLGPGVSCPCHCFISKALFRGHSETRNGTKETKKKKRRRKKKTQNILSFLFPSSILLSGHEEFSLFSPNRYVPILFLNPRSYVMSSFLLFHLLFSYSCLSFLPISASLFLLLCRGSTIFSWTRRLHTIFLYRFLKSAL